VPGLKTPLIPDKMAKKQPFAMTPDIHTKTYAERSGLGGIGAAGLGGLNSAMAGSSAGGQAAHSNHYGSIHGSAKTSKNQHLMGLTLGGQSAINTNSMLAGISGGGNHGGPSGGGQPTNNSNLGMYSGGNNLDHDSELQSRHNRANNPNGSPGDFDNLGEDLIMMNIPREGNAD
jgi:hypothetical protein